jgi:hypothetical protein
MADINFDEKQKNELNELWEQFQKKYDDMKRRTEKKKLEDLIEGWVIYRDKIRTGTLTLEEYTNTKDITNSEHNKSDNLPGGYLCDFLIRTTTHTFGSSTLSNAENFGVKLNKDHNTYFVRGGLEGSGTVRKSREDKANYDAANIYFKKEIMPILIDITVAKMEPKAVATAIENADYSAKQVLKKIAVLENMDDFLYMYNEEVIDSLYDIFIGKAEADEANTELDDNNIKINSPNEINLYKNHLLRDKIDKILGLKDKKQEDPLLNVMVSRFIWKYATAKGLADKNSPNVILYGPPGTGKTYEVRNSLEYLCKGDRSRYELIQFHPSFSYEDFIEGIKPKGVSADGSIKFELVNGIFKRFCMKAKNRGEEDFYFVVDEINRANLSSVFGETLVCLERDYRHVPGNNDSMLIKTQYSPLIEDMINDNQANKSLAYHYEGGNAYFGVPKNVFFVGMMNDVDKSIDTFDLALRRRFKWIRKDCDYEVIENQIKFKDNKNGQDFTNTIDFRKACEKLNLFISSTDNNGLGMGKSFEFGHSFFMNITSIAKKRKISIKNINELFRLYLQPTLKEYLRAIFAESELDQKVDEALDRFREPMKDKAK